MNTSRRVILRELGKLEADSTLLGLLRTHAKTESGNRLSDFGRAVLVAGRAAGIKQADLARILEITPGAVSQHYKR